MSKYNIVELKEKKAEYRSLVSPQTLDELSESVLQILVMNKKYLDKDYSALKLARELGTNTRYIWKELLLATIAWNISLITQMY